MNLKRLLHIKDSSVDGNSSVEGKLEHLLDDLYYYTGGSDINKKDVDELQKDLKSEGLLKQGESVYSVLLHEGKDWHPVFAEITLTDSPYRYVTTKLDRVGRPEYFIPMDGEMLSVFMKWLSAVVDSAHGKFDLMSGSPEISELLDEFLEIAENFISEYSYKGEPFKVSIEKGRKNYESSDESCIVVRYPDGGYRGMLRFYKYAQTYELEVSVPLSGSYEVKFDLNDAESVIEDAVGWICS